jgi:ribosome biogenesis ATPase
MKFLISELATNLQLLECSEGNIDLVCQNLVMTNAEFKRIPKVTFRSLAGSLLKEVVDARGQAAAAAGKTGLVEREKISSTSTSMSSVSVSVSTPKKSLMSTTETNGGVSGSVNGRRGMTGTGVKRKRGSLLKDKSDMSDSDAINSSVLSAISAAGARPSVRLSDLAGLDTTVQTVKELVFYPVQLPTLYQQLGIHPPSGLLLHGPSGCGKTTLAMAIGGELDLPFFKVSGPELIGGTSGESETRIRELFDNAIRHAPSIVFIDAIDVIAGKREASQRGMDRRVVAQLFDCIDDIRNLGKVTNTNSVTKNTLDIADPLTNNEDAQQNTDVVPATSDASSAIPVVDKNADQQNTVRKHVIFIAATDKPDNVDPGVRGRFSKELALPVPDAKARALILKLATNQMKVDNDVDFDMLGKSTPGFVGADLHALCSEAGVVAVKRIVASFSSENNAPEKIEEFIKQHSQTSSKPLPVEESECNMDVDDIRVEGEASSSNENSNVQDNDNYSVIMADFLAAAKNIQPSAKREGFAVVPDVTWNDVGALSSVREELLHNVIEPISHPERFIQLGLEVPAGVLFFGPPGKNWVFVISRLFSFNSSCFRLWKDFVS